MAAALMSTPVARLSVPLARSRNLQKTSARNVHAIKPNHGLATLAGLAVVGGVTSRVVCSSRSPRGHRGLRHASSVSKCGRSASQTNCGDAVRPPSLEVWSFNLRTEFCDAQDGLNGWSKRRDGVAAFIDDKKPALICAQEATQPMIQFLANNLGSRYEWVASSRKPDALDESAGFLFDVQRLQLQEHSVDWLAPEGVPKGEPAWDAGCPRTFETALFQILPTNGDACVVPQTGLAASSLGRVRVLNTHLDHLGVRARVESATMLASAIARWSTEVPDDPSILCGDFNSPKGGGNRVYEMLTSLAAPGLKDACREAELASLDKSTIHKFRGIEFEAAQGDGTVDLSVAGQGDVQEPRKSSDRDDSRHIDWILWRDGLSLRLRPRRFDVITDTLKSGRYPSDHFPISTTFDLEFQGASR